MVQPHINTLLLTIHILQESQELTSNLRHMLRGMNKFAGEDGASDIPSL